MEKIQVLKPYYRIDECLNEIKECLEIGWTGMGFKTVEFEKKWCEYTKLKYSHFLNSATSGLHLAVRIFKDKYNWSDDSEIITTPFTFVSTNHAIKYENLKPVFADIDNSLNINPESFKQNITSKTRAIIFVGVGGNTKNLDEIVAIAAENDIKVILDAAHMAGSYKNGKHAGHNADVSVFSFQAVKNLPTSDSGMICFREEEFDKKARELSWLGINKDTFQRSKQGNYKWDYNVNSIGYKYHGNSIVAALGIVGLKYLDIDNAFRRKVADWYINNLKNDVEIIYHETDQSSRHLFQIVVENREDVIDKLTSYQIYPGVHYRQNIDYFPYSCDTCKKSSYYSERILTLPMHLYLTKEDVDRVSNILLNKKQKISRQNKVKGNISS